MQLDNIPSLRSYLIKRLTVISDADPAALSDYIIALLKHEKSPEELKAFCINQLSDFLHSETVPFVEGVFRRITDSADGREGWETKETEIENQPTNGTAMETEPVVLHHEREPDRRYRLEREQREREREREWQERRSRERYQQQRHGARPPRPGRSRSPGHASRPYDAAFRSGGRQYGRGGGGGFRRTSSSAGPFATSDNARLVVDKIPPDYCTIAKVNEYFERFGKIINITVHPEIQRARIEFSNREEAMAAHSCPDVLFENRFVKVYWDHEELPTPAIVKSAFAASPRPPLAASPPMSSMASAARAETVQKKQEALKGMLELQRQKQELLLKYITQQKELLSILETKGLPEGDKQEMLQKLRSIDELIKSLDSPAEKPSAARPASADASAQTDRSSSEPGEREDTSASTALPVKSAPASTATTPILRGGPVFYVRGRGRGGHYGGAYYQGHYRQPFNPHASLAAHRLDLRPTAFILRPVPAQVGADIGSIRKLFAPYGEIKNISIDNNDGSSAIVSFVRRADAEKAHQFISKADFGGESFEVHWVSSNASGTHSEAAAFIAPAMSIDHSMTMKEGEGGTDTIGMKSNGTDEDHIRFDEEEKEEEGEESHWKR